LPQKTDASYFPDPHTLIVFRNIVLDGEQIRTVYIRYDLVDLQQRRDRCMQMMIVVALRKDWKHEFQRPIYFLMTREGYVCGWCELDKKSEWLTLVPHPLSPASSRRWKYRTEIENLGRVVVVAIRLEKLI
jgi:hypothetical protein